MTFSADNKLGTFLDAGFDVLLNSLVPLCAGQYAASKAKNIIDGVPPDKRQPIRAQMSFWLRHAATAQIQLEAAPTRTAMLQGKSPAFLPSQQNSILISTSISISTLIPAGCILKKYAARQTNMDMEAELPSAISPSYQRFHLTHWRLSPNGYQTRA